MRMEMLHEKLEIHGCFKNRVTLKAFANVSPGFALKPWVENYEKKLFATLNGLRGFKVATAFEK